MWSHSFGVSVINRPVWSLRDVSVLEFWQGLMTPALWFEDLIFHDLESRCSLTVCWFPVPLNSPHLHCLHTSDFVSNLFHVQIGNFVSPGNLASFVAAQFSNNFFELQVSHANTDFTLSRPMSILIHKDGRQVEEELCFLCHPLHLQPLLKPQTLGPALNPSKQKGKSLFCWSWHFLHVSPCCAVWSQTFHNF